MTFTPSRQRRPGAAKMRGENLAEHQDKDNVLEICAYRIRDLAPGRKAGLAQLMWWYWWGHWRMHSVLQPGLFSELGNRWSGQVALCKRLTITRAFMFHTR